MQQQQQQQTTAQGAQPLMMEPPQVVTTKDLLYLKDAMSWQLNAMKKCAHFAQECQEPQISAALNKAGEMHNRHYQMLLKHTQNQNVQAMAQIPQPSQSQ
jgi:hypothetical protein